MPVITTTLEQLENVAKAALFGNTSSPIVLIPGDPLLALIQASCIGDMVITADIQQLARYSRASSSEASDLDSFYADFGFIRIVGFPASGYVSVSASNAGAAVFSVGQQIGTGSGVVYQVVADQVSASFPNGVSGVYASGPQTYTIPVNSTVRNIPVQSLNVGSSQNVAAGALAQFLTTVTNAGSVTNEAAITNGRDAETDPEFRSRFQRHILSLGKATEDAIASAIMLVLGANADFILLENTQLPNTFAYNFFTVVAENGDGTLTTAQKSDITTEVNKVRGFGVGFTVVTPTIDFLDVSFQIILDGTLLGSQAGALSAVAGAVSDVMNKKRIGAQLFFSEITDAVMDLREQFPVIVAMQNLAVSGVLVGDEVYTPARTHLVRLGVFTLSTSNTDPLTGLFG